MIKKLEISGEEALAEYPTASKFAKTLLERAFGKEFFAPKEMKDKINSYIDVCEKLGTLYETLYPATTCPEKRSANALMMAFNIARCYNNGRKLDWKNVSQPKYVIYSCLAGGTQVLYVNYWDYCVYCPAGLAFFSADDAEDALSKFKSVYEDLLMIK